MSDPTVREAIEQSLETLTTTETPAAPAAAPATPAPPVAAPAAASPTGSDAAAPSKDAPAGVQPGQAPPVAAKAKPKQADLFAPVEKALAPKPAAAAPAPAPAAAELKAPASWKADLREKWKTLPAEVQGEVIRREKENDARMQESASLRRFAQEFRQVSEPYRAFIEAEGANPLAAFHDYLKTAALLRTGAPADKARMVASLVQQYQIPLAALDAYLAAAIRGGPQPQQQQPYTQQAYTNGPGAQQFRDPRVDQILERNAAMEREQVVNAMSEFAGDAKNEFFADVRGTMADVMDAAAKRGIVMGLADAYARACQIEPEVKKVLDARAAQGSVGAAARTLAAARHAASSVPSAAAPPASRNASAAPASVREAILQSIDTLTSAA